MTKITTKNGIMARRSDLFDMLERLDARVSILETFIFGSNASVTQQTKALPIPIVSNVPSLSESDKESWMEFESLKLDSDLLKTSWLDQLVSSPTHSKKLAYSKSKLLELRDLQPHRESNPLIVADNQSIEEEFSSFPSNSNQLWSSSPRRMTQGKSLGSVTTEAQLFDSKTISNVDKAMKARPIKKTASRMVEKVSLTSTSSDSTETMRTEYKFGLLVHYPPGQR